MITFKDKQTKNQYYILLKHMQALCYGKLKYSYANEYIPLPVGGQLGSRKTPAGEVKQSLKPLSDA